MVLISTFSASDRSALPSSSTLWKAPATMLLVPPTPALPPASSCNHTIKRKRHRTASFSTQQAGSNGLLRGGAGEGGGALEQQLRRRRGREVDRLCGAEKHRLATNRTSTSTGASLRVS